MNVIAVADKLGGNLMPRQDRACEPGRTMRDRGHPVEQMRRVSGASFYRRHRDVEVRTRMPERHDVTCCDKAPHEIDPAGQLGSDGDYADTRSGSVDDVENLRAGERPGDGATMFIRRAEAFQRLRPTVIRVDEVALEVSVQHPR